MGFYQVVSSFYTGCGQYEDESIRGIMIYLHLSELFDFHKSKTTDFGIPIPNVKKFFKSYIDDWNALIKEKGPMLNDMVELYINSKCDYII